MMTLKQAVELHFSSMLDKKTHGFAQQDVIKEHERMLELLKRPDFALEKYMAAQGWK